MQGLIFLLVIVCVNGFIALSEMSLISSRKIRLQSLAEQGWHGANVALDLAESPTRFLASMQICLTILGIMAGVYGGVAMAAGVQDWIVVSVPSVAKWSHGIGMTLVVAFETFLMVFLGELLPKRLALLAPEAIAVRVAPTMRRIGLTLTPVANVLSHMTDAVLAKLPIGVRGEEQQSVTEDEFKMIVEQGADEGVIDRNEEAMIKRVLQFGDVKAQDLMTPRTKIVGIDLNDPIGESMEKMLATSHAYFPVFNVAIDNLVGIVSIKKIFEQFYRSGTLDLSLNMSEPLFLPDTMRAGRVLESMKERGTHMAVLIDEFGGMAGVVTATDIVASVMGEVPQNSGDVAPKFVTRGDGSILIDGMASLFELSDKLDIDLALFGDVAQTLSGLVMHIAKAIPKEGQCVQFGGWSFEVVDMDGYRIDKVLAQKHLPLVIESSPES
jgi:putative hemolysin